MTDNFSYSLHTQALLDALGLCKAIVSSQITHPKKRPVSAALRDYESEMCMRSGKKVQKSREAAFYLHSEAALAEGDITRAAAAQIISEQGVGSIDDRATLR
jgi:hypothetical protein